jgi:FkbM family methyltransferase
MSQLANKRLVRFSWSHRLWIHRFLVKCFNQTARFIPFNLKYAIGKSLRKNQFPYKLIQPGSTIVQIGAPSDTLLAGRSRGMYFSLFNGAKGKTVIIEPAETSEQAFKKLAAAKGLKDLIFCKSGAWNKPTNLVFYFDPNHPATNFTEGTVDYDQERLAQFQRVEIPCDTVDNILSKHNIGKVDLLSITTNGAEIEILEGMRETMKQGLDYICLALHEHRGDFKKLMDEMGYEEFAYDDRGITYRRKDKA